MANITKLFSSKNILVGIVIIFLIAAVLSYSNTKKSSADGMSSDITMNNVGVTADGEPSLKNSAAQNVASYPKQGSSSTGTATSTSSTGGYKMQNVANPSDLLPTDANSSWAKLNPNANNNQVIIPDLLEAGYHIGLDTIGQTLKNPNLQERSEPIIPKQTVSPWNNSSFEPDIARVPLEIGYGCS
jgi:hypothetical protein